MRFLLDTCTMIWYFEGNPRIGPDLRETLRDPRNEVFVSDVSALEVVIKHQRGKLPLPKSPSRILPLLMRKHYLDSLPLTLEAIFRLEALPPLHGDPFDRLLIAQSLCGELTLVTPDPKIRQYEVVTRW